MMYDILSMSGLFGQMQHANATQSGLNPYYGTQSMQSGQNPYLQDQMTLEQMKTEMAQHRYEMEKLLSEIEKRELDVPISGAPTKRELQKYESVKNSWEEYLVVRRMTIGK